MAIAPETQAAIDLAHTKGDAAAATDAVIVTDQTAISTAQASLSVAQAQLATDQTASIAAHKAALDAAHAAVSALCKELGIADPFAS